MLNITRIHGAEDAIIHYRVPIGDLLQQLIHTYGREKLIEMIKEKQVNQSPSTNAT